MVKIDRTEICGAIWAGNLDAAQKLLSALLLKSVSYYDYQEYGVGRPDVVIKDDDRQRALVIEVKYARTEGEIQAKFKEAQKQFIDGRYLECVPDDYTSKTGYCAVFCQKKCFLERVPQ